MNDSSTTTRIALGCGLGIAIAVPMLGLLIGGAYFASQGHAGHTEATLGQAAGMVTVPVFAGCVGAGLAWMYRRWLGALFTVSVLALVLGALGLFFAISARAPATVRALTDADRAPPVMESAFGQPMLVQHAVGLAFPSPPGLTYVANDEGIAQTLAAQHEIAPHMVGWRYTNGDASQQLVVLVDLEPVRSSEQQDTLFAGVVEGARDSLAPQGFTNVTSEPGARLEHVLRAQIPGTTRGLMMRIFGYTHDGVFVIATVSVGGESHATLEPVANGARSLGD